ncbi:MAG: efflux transporter periplasmic adaptor subunit [Chitinophagaceae bacterium]|nr:efflux transporter periplasmic adaptor subunit [Chitinophagaceae bacterium]
MTHKNTYLFFIAAITALVSCGEKKQTTQTQVTTVAVPVTLDTVSSTNAVYYDEYPATIAALNEIKLTSQVTGYVTGLHFRDGSKVRQGQLLYSIDAQVYQANYQQAVAGLEVQEANLAKASKDAERYHELDKHDAIAKQQVDNADAAYEVAKKLVAAAKANVASVRSNVKFANIYAPFTGTIGISQVKQGTSVVAGQTVLNTISTDNPIAVDFAVDQKEIYRFEQMHQAGNAGDRTFTLAFGEDVYPYSGNIKMIDRAVDPQTGSIKTRLVFPNDKGMLKAGMNATVRVKNNAAAKSTIIPYKAVTEQLGEFFVYVTTDSSKVTQRKVVLGKQIGSDIIVKSGLTEGEKIAVEGVQNLKEGSVYTTAPPKPAGAPAK